MSPSEGSYFGLPLSQQTAQGPKLQMPETPFFTPGIFPATPYHHQPSESHRHQQHQENAGFAAALERGSLRHPSLAAATSGTKRLVQTSSPTHTPSISSGATPFFADLNLDTSQSNPTKSAPSPMSQPMRHRSLASNSPPVIKLPALPSPKRSSTAAAKSSTPSEAFPPIASPDILPAWFFDQLSETLVLDLRPHSVYYHSLPGRLRGSINLCVPTTLLRRPNYHLSKLIDTLPEKQQRDALGQVLAPDSGLKRVIVTDQDSVVLSPSGPLASILFKIQREREERGLTPLQLVWLKSGMQGLSRDAKLRQSGVLVLPGHSDEAFFPTTNEESPPQIVRTDSDSSDQSSNSAMSVCSTLSSDQQSDDTATPPILQVRSLPRSAFENTSTQQYKNNNPTKLSLSATSSNSALSTRTAANPFFDAIRQNREMVDLDTSLKSVPPLPLPEKIEKSVDIMPGFLKSLVQAHPTQRARRLASEFHQLESLEQSRLSDVMQWHSASQRDSSESAQNPLSISAGVEKGHLNRYRNIFPYEHSRCRLVDHNRQETDYINASHIRFRASKKHFIASQGPLAAATDDFWQLVWQERVGVIVMLCNLKEGGMEKCHSYFDEGVYGPLRLRRIASTSPERPEATQAEQDQHAAQGFFSAADMNRSQSVNRTEDTTTAYTARREFNLDRPSDRSHQTPSETRQLRHFQFGNWPDFDIPPDPHTLIRFINEVDAANTEVAQLNGFETPGPVLVHCSAGVGRTGCFMVIDTLLDQLGLQDQGSSRMSVDEPLHPQPVYPEHSGFDSAQTPPLLRDDPVFSTVNEMREQRMSMVANLAQYQFIHMALMAGLASAVVTPKASEGPSASAA